MEVRKCPRCGEDMEYNPIVLDYVCINCKMLSKDVWDKVLTREFILDFVESEQDTHRLMDTVDDNF